MKYDIPLSLLAGFNLKKLIKVSKYKTQEIFAYEFGAEIRTVSRWVNGGIKNIDTLEEVADFLKVDVLELLKNDGEDFKGE